MTKPTLSVKIIEIINKNEFYKRKFF